MICIFFFLQSQKKMCTFATMFEYCRKHTKRLILILLSLFFATFVVYDYDNNPKRLSSLKLSEKKFRGLVRRYAPRPISTYNRLFKNGTNLKKVCAIFYSENQINKRWTLQVF